jgi:outer membrane protein OmpA-like peptidoglycan-associated protein/tetratricopeptide (TPR) repeat protein
MIPAMRSFTPLVLLLIAPLLGLLAQERLLKKADEHYKNGEYAQAIPLFEQALLEKDNISTKTKLAFCYRINNKLSLAENLYRQIVQSDKAKPVTFFSFGEVLMGNAKYDEAKQWFQKYSQLAPDDPKGPAMVAACESAKTIQPFFPEIKVFPFSQNSDADDGSAVFWGGGVVYSSDRNPGVKLLKEKAGQTGRDYIQLYFSRERDPGVFAEPEKYSSKLNELNKNTGNASFSYDSSAMFFNRNSSTLNKNNTFNLQLFQAAYAGNGRWKDVEPLSFCVEGINYMHPAIAPDGSALYFVSDRSSGLGGADIYVSKRKKDGAWGTPENLGPAINTVAHEGFPFVDREGRLYFCSKGHPGFGGFDIFVSSRDASGQWAKPLNLGKPINSPQDDISIFIEKTNTRGLFTSARMGTDDDIFVFYLPDSLGRFPQQAIEALAKAPQPAKPPTSQPATEVVEVSLSENSDTLEAQPTVPVAASAKKDEQPAVQPAEPAPVTKFEPEKPASKTATTPEPPATPPAKTPEPPKSEPPKDTTVVAPPPVVSPPARSSEAKSDSVQQAARRETERMPVPPAKPFDPARIDTPQREAAVPASRQNDPSDTAQATPVLTSFRAEEASIRPESPPSQAVQSFGLLLQVGGLATARPGQSFVIDMVKFGIDAYEITPAIAAELDKVYSILQLTPSLRIEIGGHTELIGDDRNNLTLSRYRAEAAAAYLVRRGIAQERILANGYGETEPFNNCRTEADCTWSLHLVNQRLQVRLLSW